MPGLYSFFWMFSAFSWQITQTFALEGNQTIHQHFGVVTSNRAVQQCLQLEQVPFNII